MTLGKMSTQKAQRRGNSGRKRKGRDRLIKKRKRQGRALRGDLPWSERWFWSQWSKLGMVIDSDLSNYPLHGYIPDVLNKKYKYLIEVDGSAHNGLRQHHRDKRKDDFYDCLGYRVFRIKGYCVRDVERVAESVTELRREYDQAWPSNGRKIIK